MPSLGPLFNLYAFACHVFFAYFASQTSSLCNAFPSVHIQVCTLMLRALRLTNIGFVQCLQLGSLWNFARVCFYVLRASPRKHRVCSALFPRPLLIFYARVCHVLLCVLCLTNIGFVQCFSLGSLSKSLYAYLSRVLLLCVFSLANMGFVQCLSLGPPVKFVRLSLSCYAMRISPHKHQFRAVLFSRLPFKFPRLYWSCFVKTVKFVSAFLKHFETL